jgi:hypothetical protein
MRVVLAFDELRVRGPVLPPLLLACACSSKMSSHQCVGGGGGGVAPTKVLVKQEPPLDTVVPPAVLPTPWPPVHEFDALLQVQLARAHACTERYDVQGTEHELLER